MPRVSIVQTRAGDPFLIYRQMTDYIISIRPDPDFRESDGYLTYGSQAYWVHAEGLGGPLVAGGGQEFFYAEHMALLSAYPGGPITGYRADYGLATLENPTSHPELVITGFTASESTALYDLEARARLYAFDYSGSAGNDSLVGTDYDDVLNGNEGNDYLNGGLSNDIVYGGIGNDELRGGIGADTIYGGQNEDKLFGGNGWDTLLGGTGNDTLTGGLGADLLDGGEGFDTVDYTYATTGIVVDMNNSGLNAGVEATGDVLINIERVNGGQYVDDLRGTTAAETLFGNFGDDFIYGRGGDDLLIGSAGTDHLYGGAGADTFQFLILSGTDYVEDFSFAGGDVLQVLLGSSVDSFAEIMNYAVQSGNDTAFVFGGGYNLVVRNALIGQFAPTDFSFV